MSIDGTNYTIEINCANQNLGSFNTDIFVQFQENFSKMMNSIVQSCISNFPATTYNFMNTSLFPTSYNSSSCVDTFTTEPRYSLLSPKYNSKDISQREPLHTQHTEHKANSGGISYAYRYLSQKDAEIRAKEDPELEYIGNGGEGWDVATGTWYTDIKYLAKGAGNVLTAASKKLGFNLTVTSALGTGSCSPHFAMGYCSHHNSSNPKIDFRIPFGMTAEEFASKLRKTGCFSHVYPEGNHVDVQIDKGLLS